MEKCRKKEGEKAQESTAEEIKEVKTVGRSGHRQECRELVLTNPKQSGKQLNTVANFRTVPMKYDSVIESMSHLCALAFKINYSKLFVKLKGETTVI